MIRRFIELTKSVSRALLRVSAFAYPVFLLGIVLAFRYIGESWWVTSVGLYLPRLPLLAPLLLLSLLRLAFGPRKLLWLELAGLFIGLFPLAGLVVSLPRLQQPAPPTLRVLSWNVNAGLGGYDEVAREIERVSPDVAVLQELFIDPTPLAQRIRKVFPHVEVSTQFMIASRFPIVATWDPEKIAFENKQRSPRFLRHVLDTPLGRLVIYNVHPISPRSAFYKLRGRGLRREILTGHILSGDAAGPLSDYAALRELQLSAVSEDAAHQTLPVIIAGDLNSPGLSPVLSRYFSDYRDGFSEVGFGFGYTFPKRKGFPAWMRLDRIFASQSLGFTHFEVLSDSPSDHLCIVAELRRH